MQVTGVDAFTFGGLQKKLNKELDQLYQENKKVIDVKYSSPSASYYSALILYQTEL
ncbi:hypothetical protein [Eupransor demetentiae]|uniref:Uncharacterized protein n=1 Tax=Eupransor demetentiae TaxID=3109584 RepID=A0ABM9N5L7_9LACO|nr:hypothetical protein R54876_GBNLAHCA_01040 [Lactobacillaceae bacterium LMG 33000]